MITFDLSWLLFTQQYMHLTCFFLLIIAKWKDNTSLDSHISVFLQIASLVTYSVLTFYNIDHVRLLEDVRYFDCINYTPGDLGNSMQWVILEIAAFFMNLVVLFLILC